jgi:hypothetical protein
MEKFLKCARLENINLVAPIQYSQTAKFYGTATKDGKRVEILADKDGCFFLSYL